MYDELHTALNSARVEKLNELTRKQLDALIRKIQQLQLRRNDAFRGKMLTELRAFAQADARLNRDIMQDIEGKTVEEAYAAKDGYPLLGLLALRRNRAGRARLWALISSTPDPATGLTPTKLLSQYLGYLRRNIRDLVVRGYSNGWTVAETMREIFGTKGLRFRDGFVARAMRQGSAMLHTLVQHVSSVVQAGVASIFYKFYEWVAILDQFTTKICMRRDGQIYQYRKGPLPPAHFRCRSRAVPVRKGATYQNIPGSFYGWLKQQPAAVQDDFVGASLAGGLRSGRVNASGLGRFRARKQLTLGEFLAKFDLIILT
jgi:SPP1 gp7 family putative phage head morphogenesis protein